MVRSRDVIHMV